MLDWQYVMGGSRKALSDSALHQFLLSDLLYLSMPAVDSPEGKYDRFSR